MAAPLRGKDRQRLGRAGEDRAAAWYTERGFAVLDRNWRCRHGEIDLVVRRGPLVAFVEVKTRGGSGFGDPVEAVTGEKRRRLRRLAAAWIAAAPERPVEVRFDVVGVLPTGLSVIPGAF
ncbi:MAG: YraN family protein [Actinobacteria bacterium]|nr:YraN family protein [Actinomycetota bacterium]